jgi:hypothetical protein
MPSCIIAHGDLDRSMAYAARPPGDPTDGPALVQIEHPVRVVINVQYRLRRASWCNRGRAVCRQDQAIVHFDRDGYCHGSALETGGFDSREQILPWKKGETRVIRPSLNR